MQIDILDITSPEPDPSVCRVAMRHLSITQYLVKTYSAHCYKHSVTVTPITGHTKGVMNHFISVTVTLTPGITQLFASEECFSSCMLLSVLHIVHVHKLEKSVDKFIDRLLKGFPVY